MICVNDVMIAEERFKEVNEGSELKKINVLKDGTVSK
jgi:hypothetical protein